MRRLVRLFKPADFAVLIFANPSLSAKLYPNMRLPVRLFQDQKAGFPLTLGRHLSHASL
jgi:hypothetical protein